eukprot:Nitzschia sp. Nitz4//scaffold93_size78505//74311//74859//NITZ4_005431-RA/size78505-exonerate_est2genome-gene-0.57-mRNA-1//1//CDS//3329560321//7408//frame0
MNNRCDKAREGEAAVAAVVSSLLSRDTCDRAEEGDTDVLSSMPSVPVLLSCRQEGGEDGCNHDALAFKLSLLLPVTLRVSSVCPVLAVDKEEASVLFFLFLRSVDQGRRNIMMDVLLLLLMDGWMDGWMDG